jgi:hypothetical protein
VSAIGAWLGALWEFIARWFTRPPGDGSMRGAAFVRYAGADGLGHVGWAFDYDAADVNAGAVENPSGAAKSDPADMGYWDVFVPSPIPAMAEKGYNALKYVNLKRADPVSAYRVARWVATLPYEVIGRNCLDDVYDILRAYGVSNLPVPSQDFLPDVWFDQLSATLAQPAATFVWSRTGARSPRIRVGLAMAKVAPPKMPSWRRVGDPDWRDFQSQLESAHRAHAAAAVQPSSEASKE